MQTSPARVRPAAAAAAALVSAVASAGDGAFHAAGAPAGVAGVTAAVEVACEELRRAAAAAVEGSGAVQVGCMLAVQLPLTVVWPQQTV